MKINPLSNPNILKAYSKNQAFSATPAKAASAMDEVSFSKEALSFSKTLAEVRETAAANVTAPARQARLEELSQQIQNGQYSVSSGDLADKMVADILGRYQG